MATDVTSTNGGDADIRSGSPTTNRSTPSDFAAGYHTGTTNLAMRGLVQFTLPSDPGSATITAVNLRLAGIASAGTTTINCHRLTRTFVENQVTWNQYSSGNNWTNAGGDYNSSVISSRSSSSSGSDENFPIMGAGATNPITLAWGDSVGFLLKAETESGNNYSNYSSKEDTTAAKRPYLEITYTTGATAESKMLLVF
jgi:hypothetical protein